VSRSEFFFLEFLGWEVFPAELVEYLHDAKFARWNQSLIEQRFSRTGLAAQRFPVKARIITISRINPSPPLGQ